MEFSLGGITITSEDIINLYRILSSHYNKDRDTICLGLILLDRFFLDWYTVVKDFTSREIAKHMLSKGEKMTVEEASNFLSFTRGVRRASQAKIFEIFLEDVERKYE